MDKKFVKEIDVGGRLVFVRNDFNVPMDGERNILDDTRIRASLPTLQHLLDEGARVVCASHLGRPKGERKPEYGLKPVSHRLSEMLNRPVQFIGEITGREVDTMKESIKPGELVLLENLRFSPGETAGEDEFARELAKGIDIYVNDAFGACHRSHASVVNITRFVPIAVAGLLLKKEIDYLSLAVEKASESYVLVLGGAKVADKIPVINHLLDKASVVLIGGAMAYTFLKARGVDVGLSRVENDSLQMCRDIMAKAEERGVRLLLPVDHVAAVRLEPNVTIRMIERGKVIPEDMMGLDIGAETVSLFTREIGRAQLIVWNGPMGVFEVETFAGGTMAVAQAVADSPATSIVGGGDSVAAIHAAGVAGEITHISTGGGASLEFLSGKLLPGLAALTDA